MRIAVLIVCSTFLFGQNASSPREKSQTENLHVAAKVELVGGAKGADFGPYLQSVLRAIKSNWYRLIPASVAGKTGEVTIEFAVAKDGAASHIDLKCPARTAGLNVSCRGDPALDRPAWLSITASNPFSPLPTDFGGDKVALRVHFYYNPDWDESGKPETSNPAH